MRGGRRERRVTRASHQQPCLLHNNTSEAGGGGLLKIFAASRGAPWPAFTRYSEKFEPGGVRRAAIARAVNGTCSRRIARHRIFRRRSGASSSACSKACWSRPSPTAPAARRARQPPRRGRPLMSKITSEHLARQAVVYIRDQRAGPPRRGALRYRDVVSPDRRIVARQLSCQAATSIG